MALAFDTLLGTNTAPTSATTITLTTTAAAAAGSKIFVDCANFSASQALTAFSGGGLTWNIDLQATNGSQRYARVSADAPAGLAASTVLTATFGTGSADKSISAFSATGVATGITYDGTNTSTAGAGATWSSGAITTANANDILVGGGTEDGSGTATATPDTNYIEANDFLNATSTECWESVYRIVGATGTYTAGGTFSPSGTQSVGLIVAYKEAAGGATVLPRPIVVVDSAVAHAANY